MKEIKSDVLVDLVASRLQSKYENVGIRFCGSSLTPWLAERSSWEWHRHIHYFHMKSLSLYSESSRFFQTKPQRLQDLARIFRNTRAYVRRLFRNCESFVGRMLFPWKFIGFICCLWHSDILPRLAGRNPAMERKISNIIQRKSLFRKMFSQSCTRVPYESVAFE